MRLETRFDSAPSSFPGQLGGGGGGGGLSQPGQLVLGQVEGDGAGAGTKQKVEMEYFSLKGSTSTEL